jgi:molecular chaperone IbpA
VTVNGKKATTDEARACLYRGLARHGFERNYELADHGRVTRANLEHDMLGLRLNRQQPVASHSRRISVGAGKADETANNANPIETSVGKPKTA